MTRPSKLTIGIAENAIPPAIAPRRVNDASEINDPPTPSHVTDGVMRPEPLAATNADAATHADQSSETSPQSNPPRQTKAAFLRERLGEPRGASMAALMEMTGWQAHTVRAALSGLRKAGVTITRRTEGEDTIYEIARVGPAASDGGEGPTPDAADRSTMVLLDSDTAADADATEAATAMTVGVQST